MAQLISIPVLISTRQLALEVEGKPSSKRGRTIARSLKLTLVRIGNAFYVNREHAAKAIAAATQPKPEPETVTIRHAPGPARCMAAHIRARIARRNA